MNRKSSIRAHVASVVHDFQHGQTLLEHLHPEDQLLFSSHGVMTVRTTNGLFVVPPLRAVWIPAGVAWFKDPEGNVLSISQHFRKPSRQ